MWEPDSYMNQLYDIARRENERKFAQRWSERKPCIRAKLIHALGEFPAQDVALQPVVLERSEWKDHLLERVAYTTEANLQMLAYVLIPKRVQHQAPAVLAWHGHGYGSREIVGLQPDGSVDEAPPGIHKHYALELVRRGLIVIAPEIIGFGDRRLTADRQKDPKKSSSCSALSSRLLLYGRTLAGLRIYEAQRSLDYLLTRKEVDPERIGCIGFSGGGLIASFSAALDSRIKAAAVCAFTSTFKGSLLAMNHCICNYIPSMYPEADLPELIGLLSPRALFVESGDRDPLFPINSVSEAVERLKEIYRQEGAERQLEVDLFPGGHEVCGRRSFDWLARQLKV